MNPTLIFAILCTGDMPEQAFEIQLKSRDIVAADISQDAPIANEILAQIAPGHSDVILTQSQQQRLLDNFFPGAKLKPRFGTNVRFIAGSRAADQIHDAKCFMTRYAIPRGEFINSDDLVDAPCDRNAVRVPIGLNRSLSAPYAAADLSAFSYVGSLKAPATHPVQAGTALHLRTVSGPVTIDRKVVAMQSGFPGNRIFVKTDDGIVIARRLENVTESRGGK